MNQHKKAIIWDWTGTIADERDLDRVVCQNMEKLIAQREKQSLEWAHLEYRRRLQEFHNTWKWYSYPYHGEQFQIDWRAAQTTESQRLRLVEHAKDVLDYFRSQGYALFLATNAARDVIELRMGWVGMTGMFDDVVTSDTVLAVKREGKHLEYLARRHHLKEANVFVVGDELEQDVEPANRKGWVSVLYTGIGEMYRHGVTDRTEFSEVQPHHRIDSLVALKRIVDGASQENG